MILYANGCSHTAAAEAVVPAAFAEDDGKHGIDRRPHPFNLAASWCTHLARDLGYSLICDAQSASSNDRIARTTRAWIDANPDLLSQTFMVIQWSTWEREEWFHNNTWYQVNASGSDWLPEELQEQYRQFVVNVDWAEKTQLAHEQIYTLHMHLQDLKISHLFYNGNSTFGTIQKHYNWSTNYLEPYSNQHSYNAILQQNGYKLTEGHHFDAKGHCFWAGYLLQYIKQNNLVNTDALPTD